MLVSNEPLGTVLDSIAQAVRDQIPGAFCVILVKQANGLKTTNDFSVAAAPGIPSAWLGAISHLGALPFEVWRHLCDYPDVRAEPAWQQLVDTPNAGPKSGEAAKAREFNGVVQLGDRCEFSGIFHRYILMGDSTKLAPESANRGRPYTQHHSKASAISEIACCVGIAEPCEAERARQQ